MSAEPAFPAPAYRLPALPKSAGRISAVPFCANPDDPVFAMHRGGNIGVGPTVDVTDRAALLPPARFPPLPRPLIDRVLPLEQARDGFGRMITGDLFGKIVFAV